MAIPLPARQAKLATNFGQLCARTSPLAEDAPENLDVIMQALRGWPSTMHLHMPYMSHCHEYAAAANAAPHCGFMQWRYKHAHEWKELHAPARTSVGYSTVPDPSLKDVMQSPSSSVLFSKVYTCTHRNIPENQILCCTCFPLDPEDQMYGTTLREYTRELQITWQQLICRPYT